jgi:hypothetical protein
LDGIGRPEAYMSGKDLLATLVMVVPSLLLVILVALSLAPPSVMAPPPGSRLARDDGAKQPDPQNRAAAAQAMQEASDRAARGLPPQKPLRDPWQKTSYAGATKEPQR